MGNITRIIELEGQVERKDAYIDKLEMKLEEVTNDCDERAELSARLFSENEQLKHQVNLKQLEIEHCHAVCDELRQRIYELHRQLTTIEADVLDREADLIIAAPADAYFAGKGWAGAHARLAERIGTMMKARAALARANVGTCGCS